MNRRQKLVQAQFLNNEETVIKRLKQVYGKSLEDITEKSEELQKRITGLQAAADKLEDGAEKDRLKSMIQSSVYQKQHQDALKKQIESILDGMQVEQFTTVSDYLERCYEDGFLGTMFDLQGQGIPLCFPLDQEAMVRAVQLDSKISHGLYARLGEDVALLKKKITAQVSRGIATGMSWQQVAQQLAGYTKIGYNNAIRIARTEGHRIQCQGTMDACFKAKEKGADVVKQWDSTLDGRTRESHAAVDGEIRELDEKFSNGLMFPGDPSGGAAEVCNCRCALLQRARWALDEGELQTLKDRAAYFGLDKTDNFEEYKKLYLKSAEKSAKMESEKLSDEGKAILETLKKRGVAYNEVGWHDTPLTEDEIIRVLSGGDQTRGSCASVGLAYVGQKGGMNVLDFRDGESRGFFSTRWNLEAISRLPGVKTITESAKSAVTAGNRLLKHVESGKEYYFVTGRHAAIVRRTKDGVLQYLELQSATQSGWTNFDGNPRYTLKYRFGDYSNSFGVDAFMIDVESLAASGDLRSILGYINTAEKEQRKGRYGTIK